jgi:hypothetical protein
LVLLQRRRFDDASKAAEAALAETPESWYVQEIAALTALYREQDRDATGDGADWALLKEVANRFLELRAHMLERGRPDEALGFLGRAATAQAAAHNTGEATALLKEALADPALANGSEDVRLELAACAVALEEWDLAEALLPATNAVGVEVLRATIAINTGDPEQALAILDSSIRDDTITSPARGEAALTRAQAAARGIGDWSPEAEEVIRGFNPTTATVLRARHLERQDKRAEAEELLIRDGSPAAQDALVAMAVDAENYSLALERMEAVVREAPTPFRRVHLAGMLLERGERTRALVMLTELRVDADIPQRFRIEAATLATKDAYDNRYYVDAAARARDWLALQPASRTAAWVLIDSLRKAGDPDAALAADHELRPPATTDWEVDVAAQLYSDNLDRASALERLAQLSARTTDANPRIAQWISRLAQ